MDRTIYDRKGIGRADCLYTGKDRSAAASVNTIGYTVKAFLMSSIVGAIISLILGAIMQKKPNIFEEQGTGGVI
jgi:hypothetical protein